MKRRWSVSDEVLAVFHGCTAAERQRLLECFERLATFPDQHADFHDRGIDGRDYLVAMFAPWILTYWVDPDGRVVRIIELELTK